MGVYEVLEMTSELRRMILAGKHANELQQTAINSGMVTLRQDASDKVVQGLTTVEEVVRVTAEQG
jgi:type II secretory ATPase GspE/PulE/Tfp pilus assembly ATPase PilB-like protein